MRESDSFLRDNADFRKAVERVQLTPGVAKVVVGSFSNASHAMATGRVKVVREYADHLDLRIYGKRGMLNVYAYTSTPAATRQALVEGRQAATPAAAASAVPAAPLPRAATPPPAPSTTPAAPLTLPLAPPPAAAPAPEQPAGITTALVTVTPEMAVDWLTRNSRNRPLRASVVKRYASDMLAGRWKAGGCTIKFDHHGVLLNGQHTLYAVYESGTSIDALVVTGLDPSVVLVEDDHSRRRLSDVARLQSPGWAVTTRDAAVAAMLSLSETVNVTKTLSRPAPSRQEELDYLLQHRDAISFSVSCFSASGTVARRGIVVAPVLAVVARAYYTENHDALRRFARVLQTGMVNDTSENAAVAMRNALLAAVGTTASTEAIKMDTFRRTERALRAFLDGEALKIIRPADEELFPLPSEPALARKRARPAK